MRPRTARASLHARMPVLALAIGVAVSAAIAQPGAGKKVSGWAKEPAAVFGATFGAQFEPRDLHTCDDREPAKISFCSTEVNSFSSPFLVAGFPVSVFRDGMLTVQDGIISSLLISARHDD
jgi:hypothetical protein